MLAVIDAFRQGEATLEPCLSFEQVAGAIGDIAQITRDKGGVGKIAGALCQVERVMQHLASFGMFTYHDVDRAQIATYSHNL